MMGDGDGWDGFNFLVAPHGMRDLSALIRD